MPPKPITLAEARANAAADAGFQAFRARPRTWLDVAKEGPEAVKGAITTRPERAF
ncbi:hypothetical protein V5F32_00945 [Xanthobacter oligotrophicus]|uniref:Antitoxin MazE n=1 Tax=Xanthobacter oligotrophicus TaxID=2607286 RepID=A0ABW6ZPS2_9HYPH